MPPNPTRVEKDVNTSRITESCATADQPGSISLIRTITSYGTDILSLSRCIVESVTIADRLEAEAIQLQIIIGEPDVRVGPISPDLHATWTS